MTKKELENYLESNLEVIESSFQEGFNAIWEVGI